MPVPVGISVIIAVPRQAMLASQAVFQRPLNLNGGDATTPLAGAGRRPRR